MLDYKNPNKDVNIKTKKCRNCSTVYIINECSDIFHKKKKCNHLKPGYQNGNNASH